MRPWLSKSTWSNLIWTRRDPGSMYSSAQGCLHICYGFQLSVFNEFPKCESEWDFVFPAFAGAFVLLYVLSIFNVLVFVLSHFNFILKRSIKK